LDGYGDGPIVAIMHGRNGWEIHICPTLGQDAGRIRITVQDVVEGRQPIVTLAGVRATFAELFDDEIDRWET